MSSMPAAPLWRHPEFARGFREMNAVSLGIAAWGLLTGVAMAKSGLPLPLALFMSVVVFAGPIRISALARAEQVQTPTMTPIVAALERDGLVTRETDTSDARAALLRATPKGARLMAEGRARRVALLAADLAALSARERAVIAEAVEILEGTRRHN